MSDDGTDSEDDALWAHVTKGVKPLVRETPLSQPDKDTPKRPKKPMSKTQEEAPMHGRAVQPERCSVQAQDIDRRTAERLRKGQMPIDARLDLHGMRRVEAYDAFKGFIQRSCARGDRCVLVITGKGSKDGEMRDPLSSGDGVLKTSLPQWADEPVFRAMVLKVQQAQGKHGGSGAYYILLRRQR